MINKDFYPTPLKLINRMLDKIKGHPGNILEPSGGKGDIIEALCERYRYSRGGDCISVIEKDPDLQATLRGKGYKLIDTDFLDFSGHDKFDLIIANPPFADGELHLLKAIDIMYCGEIIFLLNAETIKNPHTNYRKALVKKLSKLNADIEYIQGAFKNAERPTGVEIALIYINIERKVEDDLFEGCSDQTHDRDPELKENYEVSTRQTIAELVAEYNQVIKIGTETIIGYYKNYKKVGQYIALDRELDKWEPHGGDMTAMMKTKLNTLLKRVRTDFWRRTLDLDEVRKRMTSKRRSEFEVQLTQHCNMNFTESNIRQFVINFIGGYEDTLTKAVLEIFDKFTIKHSYSKELDNDNIHYFNGWKTNKAFYVNKKVIIPVYGGYKGGPFCNDYSGKWKLAYGLEELNDIDIVMNYFDGMSKYCSIHAALNSALHNQINSKIWSTYFTLTAYKKGTLHLTFNSDDILRRFNVTACRGKNFLPFDYGDKPYQDCSKEEQDVIDSFEGSLEYCKHVGKQLFATKQNELLLTAA